MMERELLDDVVEMWGGMMTGGDGETESGAWRLMWRVEIRFAALRKERIRRGAKRALDALMRRWQAKAPRGIENPSQNLRSFVGCRRSQASVTVFRFFYYTSYIIYIILAAKKNYDDFMTDMFPSPKEDFLVVPLDSSLRTHKFVL